MGILVQSIYTITVVARGLPSEGLLRDSPSITAMLKEVIREWHCPPTRLPRFGSQG